MSISEREKAIAERNAQLSKFFDNNPEADAVRDWARSQLADKELIERKTKMFAQMVVSDMVSRRKKLFPHFRFID